MFSYLPAAAPDVIELFSQGETVAEVEDPVVVMNPCKKRVRPASASNCVCVKQSAAGRNRTL